jgi:hypothetical protein
LKKKYNYKTLPEDSSMKALIDVLDEDAEKS